MVNWTLPCLGVSLGGVLAPQKAIFRAKNRLKTAENGDFHLLSVLECFFLKMEESRPPLKLKNNGGLLSAIFSKNHSKCLKLTLENSQKSGFYSSEHISLTIVKGAMRFRESPMVIIYPK